MAELLEREDASKEISAYLSTCEGSEDIYDVKSDVADRLLGYIAYMAKK